MGWDGYVLNPEYRTYCSFPLYYPTLTPVHPSSLTLIAHPTQRPHSRLGGCFSKSYKSQLPLHQTLFHPSSTFKKAKIIIHIHTRFPSQLSYNRRETATSAPSSFSSSTTATTSTSLSRPVYSLYLPDTFLFPSSKVVCFSGTIALLRLSRLAEHKSYYLLLSRTDDDDLTLLFSRAKLRSGLSQEHNTFFLLILTGSSVSVRDLCKAITHTSAAIHSPSRQYDLLRGRHNRTIPSQNNRQRCKFYKFSLLLFSPRSHKYVLINPFIPVWGLSPFAL